MAQSLGFKDGVLEDQGKGIKVDGYGPLAGSSRARQEDLLKGSKLAPEKLRPLHVQAKTDEFLGLDKCLRERGRLLHYLLDTHHFLLKKKAGKYHM